MQFQLGTAQQVGMGVVIHRFAHLAALGAQKAHDAFAAALHPEVNVAADA